MQPKSLKEAYHFLEDPLNLRPLMLHEIERGFQRLEKIYKSRKQKSICKWEMYIWGFDINRGLLTPQTDTFSRDGRVVKPYPDINSFGNAGLNYIAYRASTVVHPFLKAWYNHILWLSPIKKHVYALAAMENYMLLLDDQDTRELIDLPDVCKCLLLLSVTTGHKKGEVLERIIDLVANTLLEVFECVSLVNFYLDIIKGKTSKELLQTLLDRFDSAIVYGSNLSVVYLDTCDAAIRVSRKLQLEFLKYYEKKAEYHLAMSDERKDWIKQDFYFSALKEYELAGRTDKVEELSIMIEESKELIRLDKYSSELKGKDVQDIIRAMHSIAEKLSLSESPVIYDYLGASDNFLPRIDKKGQKKESFLDAVRGIRFDINSNISADNGARDIAYDIHFYNFTAFQLDLIFSKCIVKGSISYESLIAFLYDQSWIGKTFYTTDYEGGKHPYCWVDLLAPALQEYFRQMNILLKTGDSQFISFVAALDSLTLKMEGLIRQMAKVLRCPTTKLNKGKDGMREMYIEEILGHQTFKEYLTENEIDFILYVLTSKGMNLRNDIAHSFLKPESYKSTTMHIVITLLLRIGKFSASERTEEDA